MKNILKFFQSIWYYFFPLKEDVRILPSVGESDDQIPKDPNIVCDVRVADPEDIKNLERGLKQFKKNRGRAASQIRVIPVFVHIIHRGEAYGVGTNISDSQVCSMINSLNEDNSKEPGSRGDGMGVDTTFRFILANKDDDGNFTTGIARVNGAARSNVYADDGIRNNGIGLSESYVKNWSRQNNQRIYNIWVVSEIGGNNGGSGVQGFAYFPTTSMVDGIVQLYNASGVRPEGYTFGYGETFNLKSYTNLNRTLTHEMGHAMGLRHTFQGNTCDPNAYGDGVDDTPSTILNSNGNYPACGGTQQVENYMDYTQQYFKDMFTQGQVDRMMAVADFSRGNLLASDALSNLQSMTASIEMEIDSPKGIMCGDSSDILKVRVTNTSEHRVHKINFEYIIDGVSKQVAWYGPINVSDQDGANNYDIIGLGRIDASESKSVTVIVTAVNDNPCSIAHTEEINIPTNTPYKIEFKRDVIAGQVMWTIKKENEELVYKSPAYPNFKAGVIQDEIVCLPDGEYIFNVTDSLPGFTSPGAYIRFKDGADNVLYEPPVNFTNETFAFTVGTPIIDVPVPKKFKVENFYTKCTEKEGMMVVLEALNEKDISHYNIYQGIAPNFEDFISMNRIEANEKERGVYKFFDKWYTSSPTMYFLEVVWVDGKRVLMAKSEVECETKKPECHYVIKEGTVYSNDFKPEEIFIYTFDDKEVKNYKLTPGFYRVEFGRKAKCILKIYVTKEQS